VLKKEKHAGRKSKPTDEPKTAVQDRNDLLAQLVREVTADYRSFNKARKFASAAAKRLDTQSRAYREGRITAGAILGFVRQYAASSTAEAQCLAEYNITLASLCEASGTLLNERDIVVSEAPHPPAMLHAATPKKDNEARTTAFEKDEAHVDSISQIYGIPELEPETTPDPAKTEASQASGKTVVLSISLGGFNWELSVSSDPPPAAKCQEILKAQP
jgi:hypothetical protein